jgi:sirohydrochlorin ferrochelatase
VKTAVIILGHGSRSGGADDAAQRIAAEVRKSGVYEIVEHAFLQYVPPSPYKALENCIRKHAEKIVIVPFFMHPGAHVTKDIPAFVEKARKQHPNIEIMVTDFAGSHPLMTEIVLDLVGKSK